MIPSRPLRFSEMAHETMKIMGRTLGRSVILILIFLVPASVLLTTGASQFIHSTMDVAVTVMGFNQQDFDAVRARARNEISASNPELFERAQEAADSTSRASGSAAMKDSAGKSSTHSDSTKTDSLHSSTNRLSDTSRAARLEKFRDSLLASLDSNVPAEIKAHNDTIVVNINNHLYRKFPWRDIFQNNLPLILGSLIFLFFSGILFIIGLSGAYAAMIDSSAAEFEEREGSLSTFIRHTLRRNLWKILGLFIIVNILPSIVANILIAIAESISPSLGGFVSLVTLFLCFYVWLRLSFAMPAAVSEEIGVRASLERSWHLTTFQTLRVFGISSLFWFGMFGVSVILSIILGLLMGGMAYGWLMDFLGTAPMTIAQFTKGVSEYVFWTLIFIEILFGCYLFFLPVFTTVFYYDLRTRLDGPLSYAPHHDDDDEDHPQQLWMPQ